MPLLLIAALLSVATAATAQVRTREVDLGVYTKDGEPIEDLKAAELEIKEDGKKREVVGMRRDDRPVDVALILDSSQWMGDDYRTILVPAALEFRQALPEGSRIAVWTSGGRADRAVSFDVESEAAEATLKQAAVGGSNFTLTAIIDASHFLEEEGGARRVVVVVTTMSIPYSEKLVDGVYQAIPRARATPMVILVERSGTGGGVRVGGEGRTWDVESLLQHMAEGYGGSYEFVLTAQAVEKMLRRAAADITGQYLVRFESEAEKPIRPEVKVRRKGVIVRPGMALSVH